MHIKDIIITKEAEYHIIRHNIMKKIAIRTIEDMESLPEGEIVEVESCDVKFRLVEEGTLNTKFLISDEEVKIPLPKDLYDKIKGKKISITHE
ncbi:MAG: hypothetical protein KAU16_02835 [Methanophagales archaeon]|nr:hypothetical protein [Methanophagales archaeon]